MRAFRPNYRAALDAGRAFSYMSGVVDMADKLSRGERSCSSIFFEVPFNQSAQKVKRWRRVMFMFPAVGRLIFASYPKRVRTGSHYFDSPRPCPHSRFGSRPARRRASPNDVEGWPPHPTASPLGSSQCHVRFNLGMCLFIEIEGWH